MNDFEIEQKKLNALEDIASTLKRIEQTLNADKQHEVIKEAVSHALLGSKYKATSEDC